MSKKSVIKTKVDSKIAVTITVLAILIVGSFVIATIFPSFRLGGFYTETTNGCTVANVHFDEPGWTAPEIFSLKIYPPAGCAKPYGNAGNVDITTTGSYVCSGGARYYNTDVKINSDSVEFTAKCSIWPHYIETSDHFITVKFGADGSSGTTQYYCDRTDPVKPWCHSGYPPQPGLVSYPQCMASCVPSRNWMDISINPKQTKYQTGQIIKFLPQSNILSLLTKFSWNFDDNISRPNEPYREQPVVYSLPGRKNITLSVIDPQTNKTIATTTQIRIKCVPPSNAVPGDELITITSYLNNNYMVKIAANNFIEWARDNEQAISDTMDQYQCEYLNRDKVTEYRTLRAIQWIKNITDARQIAILDLQQLMPSAGQNTIGVHAIIALKVTDITDNFETRYSIDFLDPNGPTIMSMNCKISEKKIWDKTDHTIKLVTGMFCLHPTLDLVFPFLRDIDTNLIESLRTKFYQECNLSQTSFCQERRNLGLWLKNNYPLIDNYTPANTNGVCQGWTEFVSNVSYLGDFAGECASF